MEETEKNKMDFNKNKRSKKIIIILIILILITISAVLILFLLNNKKEDNKTEISGKEAKENYKYDLNVYKQGSGDATDYFTLCNDEDQCSNLAFTIPAETSNAKVLKTYDATTELNDKKKFVLYEDNGLKIYDYKNDKIRKISLKNNYDLYEIICSEDDTNVLGIVYQNVTYKEDSETGSIIDTVVNKLGFYNVKNAKFLYESSEYYNISELNNKYIVAFESATTNSYVLNIEKEEIVYTSKSDEKLNTIVSETTNNGYIYIEFNGDVYGYGENILLNSEFEKISKTNLYYNEYKVTTDGVYILENKNIVLYDATGEKIQSYNPKGIVQQLFDKCYVTLNDNALYIISYDGNINTKLIDWKNNYDYDSSISGYHDTNSLNRETEKEAGYYFIISEKNGEGGVEVYFNPNTQEVKHWVLDVIGGYAKPILYLYPTEKTNVEINFENEKSLTTTYPKFNNSWNVIANPNGDLYDLNGKYYYGLYWEESKNHSVDFQTGFYVTKDNAIDFLEEKLSIIGLKDKEKNEFIMYWLPIIEKNKKNLIYFELTEEREKYNKIEILPKPDSLLRVAIHVKKVDKYTKIKEQKLTTFTRVGFAAVEWGGAQH